MPAEGFVAACVQCGAPQSIVLGEHSKPCRHCGTPTPLDGATRSRLEQASHRVDKLAFTEYRRLLQRGRDAETVLTLGGVVVLPVWLLFGGFVRLACGTDWPEGVGTLELLRDEDLGRESPSIAWALWSVLFGFGLSLSLGLWAYARARAVGAPPRALPPLAGGSPRCRLCGAGLTSPGVVRGCVSCGAQNLVDGAAFHAQVSDLSAQLRELEQAEARAVTEAESVLEPLAMKGTLAAFFGPLVGALVGAVTHWWSPSMLFVAALAYAPAALAVVVLLFQSPHRVRAFGSTRPGDRVLVAGASHRVHAVLRGVGQVTSCATLHCVGPEGSPHPTLALEITDFPEFHARVFRIDPGGAALSPADAARLVEFAVEAVPSGASQGARAGAALAHESPLRVFASPAAPGRAPIWTLSPSSTAIRRALVP
jgi:hypothetical protein